MKTTVAFACSLFSVTACSLLAPPTPAAGKPVEAVAAGLSGKDLYADRCTACHELIAPGEHTFTVWEEKVREFGPWAELSRREEEAILAFLRPIARGAGLGSGGRTQ